MSRRIRRVIGPADDQLRVRHIRLSDHPWAKYEIVILRVPAAEGGVAAGGADECEDMGRVPFVETVLRDVPRGLLYPVPERGNRAGGKIPEPRYGRLLRRSRVDDRDDLVHRPGEAPRWRRRTELARAGQVVWNHRRELKTSRNVRGRVEVHFPQRWSTLQRRRIPDFGRSVRVGKSIGATALYDDVAYRLAERDATRELLTKAWCLEGTFVRKL